MTEEYPGSPNYGRQPPYGEPQYGQPQYGQPQYGAPPPNPPTAAPSGGAGGHRAQWLVAVAVVLAAAGVGAYFVFSGSDAAASTPKGAVKKLLDAGKADDIAAAKQALCAADNRIDTVDRLSSSGRITSYSIGKVVQSDSTHASVIATLVSTDNPSPLTETLPVVKEGGTWKVCVSGGIPSVAGRGGVAITGTRSMPARSASAPSASVPSIAIPSAPVPSIAIPSYHLPSIPIDLPTGAGSLTNPCSFATSADTAAITYIGLAEIGETGYAQSCVYKNVVPRSVTAGLKANGSGLYSPTGDTSGSTIMFTSIDGTSTVAVTATKETGGKYYITKVHKS